MNQRIIMTNIKEIIRLSELKMSSREISKTLGISRSSVSNYIKTFESKNLLYNDIYELNDDMLLEMVLSNEDNVSEDRKSNLIKMFPEYAKELKRTGVTLQLLWEEYKEKEVNGYGYSQFCYHYQQWEKDKDVCMHIEHKYGDKMFVDFTGDKLKVKDNKTSMEEEVETLICILGGSKMIYVEALRSQKKEDFFVGCENGFRYFGGVTKAIVPDCLRSAVTKGDKYEPDINPDFTDFGRHYDTVILPARPNHPKDKALVENAVRISYMRIFAPIRNMVFFSIEELNVVVKEYLEKLNKRRMSKINISRQELLENYEYKYLKPLPSERYEFKKFLTATVSTNYHVYLREDGHYYSVPYRFKGNKINMIYTERLVEICHRGTRIALHERNRQVGYSTNPEHMPPSHRFYAEWNPGKILSMSEEIGDNTKAVTKCVMDSSKHPEQGFKVCMGIISLAKRYGKERVNQACKRALDYEEYSYKFVNNLLKSGMEKVKIQDNAEIVTSPHENIRGKIYYNKQENI